MEPLDRQVVYSRRDDDVADSSRCGDYDEGTSRGLAARSIQPDFLAVVPKDFQVNALDCAALVFALRGRERSPISRARG